MSARRVMCVLIRFIVCSLGLYIYRHWDARPQKIGLQVLRHDRWRNVGGGPPGDPKGLVKGPNSKQSWNTDVQRRYHDITGQRYIAKDPLIAKF